MRRLVCRLTPDEVSRALAEFAKAKLGPRLPDGDWRVDVAPEVSVDVAGAPFGLDASQLTIRAVSATCTFEPNERS